LTYRDLIKVAMDWQRILDSNDLDSLSIGRRKPSPLTFILGRVMRMIPEELRGTSIEDFESNCRTLFAVDAANKVYDALGRGTAERQPLDATRLWSSETYPGRICAVRIQIDSKGVDPLREQLLKPISHGHVYHILAALYPKFPEFCDKKFPLESPHV
jgi:hypothetical protein